MKVFYNRQSIVILFKNNYFLHFSTKDMWLYPKRDRNYLNGKCDLAGWLFMYLGKFK